MIAKKNKQKKTFWLKLWGDGGFVIVSRIYTYPVSAIPFIACVCTFEWDVRR